MSDYSADQIVQAIEAALHDGEVKVVPGLIQLLAIKDPHRAQDVLDTINLGISISRERDGV